MGKGQKENFPQHGEPFLAFDSTTNKIERFCAEKKRTEWRAGPSLASLLKYCDNRSESEKCIRLLLLL